MTWFEQTAEANFKEHLLPLADEWMTCLQLGVWEGDASVWIMENLPDAFLVDVDNWKGSDEHEDFNMKEIRRTYQSRMKKYSTRVVMYPDYTTTFLGDRLSAPVVGNQFDFIYVDASHVATDVLSDLVMAWPLLEAGGLLAVDDFSWDGVRIGTEAWFSCFGGEAEQVVVNAQAWFKKRCADTLVV